MKQENRFGIIAACFLSILLSISQNLQAADNSPKTMPWVPLLLVNNTVSITISGKATIPNYKPAGQLWIVADGLDGYIYGSGPSDTEGNFNIKATIPKDIQTILLYAVDPNNPDAYVSAYIDAEEDDEKKDVAGSKGSESGKLIKMREPIWNAAEIRQLNTTSLIESLIREATGKKPSVFFAEDWQTAGSLYLDLYRKIDNRQFAIKACSSQRDSNIDNLFVELVKKHRSLHLRAELDSALKTLSQDRGWLFQHDPSWYAHQLIHPDSLLFKVRSLVHHTQSKVISSNHPSGYVSWHIPGFGQLLGINRTRSSLEHFRLPTEDSYSCFNPDTPCIISRSDLEAAVAIILNAGSSGYGYGNCGEKGLAGAYIASLFPEFKQVAHVSVMRPRSLPPWDDVPHAFAIACQDNDWDLIRLLDKRNENIPFPNELFTSSCMLIDPWGAITGRVEPITRDLLSYLKWHSVESVMKVDLTPPSEGDALAKHYTQAGFPVSTSKLLSSKTGKACSVNSNCQDCMTNPEVKSSVCKSFTPPLGNYVVWIHSESRTCCPGDFDGVAPYQYHGTAKEYVDDGAIILNSFNTMNDLSVWVCDRTVHRAYNWVSNWAEIGGYIVTNLPCEPNADFR